MNFFYLIIFTALSALDAIGQNCPLFDHSFGNGGVAIGMTANYINAGKVIVQPDNKIIQVVTNYGGFFLIRYKSSGPLDSSFGSNGKVQTEIATYGSFSNSAALQSDGKIVVTGSAFSNDMYGDFALARYLPNGNLDSSFGIDGKLTTPIGPYDDAAFDVTIQQDGKILVAGYTNDNNYTSSFAVARYQTNGTVDSSFGQNGKAVFHVGPFITYIGNYYYGRYAGEWAKVIAAQADGKIIVAGSSYALHNCYDYYGSVYCDEAFGMARLNSNGSIDSTFGSNGRVRDTLLLRTASGMAFQTDGKILVTGYGRQQAFIAERYNSNGNLDSSFGTNGKVVNNVGGSGFESESNSVALFPDGKIVLSGWASNNSFAVTRLLTNGSPDVLFNGTGSTTFQIQPGSYDYASSLAIQDGKIIVGGYSQNGNSQSTVVVRLLDNGSAILPVITAGGPLVFCAGNNVRLVSSEQGTIQWYRNNNPINGATDTSYLAAVSGTYFVRVSNSNGCGNSLPVIVTVNNNPVKPQVNWSTPLFSTTAGYPHYQWWFNDVMIADSDSNSFRATQTGEYKVTVFDSLGCRSISDSFILRVLAVGDIVIGGSKIRYYPNPVQSVLNIEVSNPYVNKFKAELYDVSGKLVLSQLLNQAHNQLPLQKLPTGFYQLVIHNEVKRVAVKLIVGR